MKKSGVMDSWSRYGEKLESEMQFDLNQLTALKLAKTKKNLTRFVIWRGVEFVLFAVCFWLLMRFIMNNLGGLQYIFAGALLGVFALIGLIRSARQMMLVVLLDYATPITRFQQKVEKLKAYNLQTLRLMFLSIPFYVAYIIIGSKVISGIDIVSHANPSWLWTNLAMSVVFILPARWLYKNLSYKTKIRWVKGLIMDNGGKQLRSALQFLEEIEQFKADD